MLYIGAEFCPICATERWPMLVALSHFGTFSNVSQTHSAVSDGDIPTLSFYGSTYTSPYLTFTPVETTTNQPSGNYYKTLETPTSAEMASVAGHTSPNSRRSRSSTSAASSCSRPPSTLDRPGGPQLRRHRQLHRLQQQHHRRLRRRVRGGA